MLRFNQSYGYSKKYQDINQLVSNQQQQLAQHRQQINDKTKKLCNENKKRRRQFEERQRIHERNEQKRREEALNSRRRRQQEATNAYKAALSKELTKRNKTPTSRISSASSIGSQGTMSRGRNIYRSPTVDEVLSNIRGHSLGGSLRTYGETSNTLRTFSDPARTETRSYTSPSTSYATPNYTSPTYTKKVLSFNTPSPPHEHKTEERTEQRTEQLKPAEASSGGVTESALRDKKQEIIASAVLAKHHSSSPVKEEVIVADSLEMGDLSARLEHSLNHHRTLDHVTDHVTDEYQDPDRIRVQIDLTKFDQLEVSDCESLDEPPIDPTTDQYTSSACPDKHTESFSDLTKLVPHQAPVKLLQSETVSSRAPNYFGPPDSYLQASTSQPEITTSKAEILPKSSSDEGLQTSNQPNYCIQSSEGESYIYANSPVEAVKTAASRTTAWSATGSAENAPQKHLKSLIKRTPSARRKQVRWDSVSALDDETMEVDQFDISAEGEAVFTRQYSHPVRSSVVRSPGPDGDDVTDTINLQRTPTDAEINALWNKVRTTLHRNQAWDAPGQSKSNLPRSTGYARRAESAKPTVQDSLRIYSNVVVDSDRYKFTKRPGSAKGPGPSAHGPTAAKMSDISHNGHTMLSMEEQRILQSLERLDAKLKDNGVYEGNEPKTQLVTYSSPTLDISRPAPRSDTYRRLLNRKTNGISTKYNR